MNSYRWAADGLRIDRQAYTASDGTRYSWPSAFTYDPEGNVVQQLPMDNVGSYYPLDTRVYDAYGALRWYHRPGDATGAYTQPYDNGVGFGGQYGYVTDPATGLVLCTHRWYDPLRGRWLNRDPIGYAGGLNVYGYCGNNPVNGCDPSGFERPPHDNSRQAHYQPFI